MIEKKITSEPTLYDPNAPLRIECGTSPYGLGAVMSHVSSDGSEILHQDR